MKPSKNSILQAARLLRPDMSRRDLFRLFNLPHTMTAHNRYWAGSYNILPWSQRTAAEQEAATDAARAALARVQGKEAE